MTPSEIRKAKELSNRVRSLGRVSPVKIVKQKRIPTPFKYQYESLKTKDGKTPVKGKDYFTPQEIDSFKRDILDSVRSEIPKSEIPSLEVDTETVKKIIQIMHSLPEVDKLEVSKGIRNAQSFIHAGTKYQTSELMHGGSNVSSSTIQVYGEVVAGSGTAWTLAHTPDTGTLRLYANGQRLTVTVDYTVSGNSITTVDSWVAGTLLADYQYS